MKAVVFHVIGDIRLDDVSEPKIEESRDAIVCGSPRVPSAVPTCT